MISKTFSKVDVRLMAMILESGISISTCTEINQRPAFSLTEVFRMWWQVATLLQAQQAQSWQLNMAFMDPDDPGQSEATQTLFAGFET